MSLELRSLSGVAEFKRKSSHTDRQEVKPEFLVKVMEVVVAGL